MMSITSSMLLPTLQEASSHSIPDLKKILAKDRRVKQILQKTLDLEEITDRVEFVQTLKFFVLNNRNVLDLVDSRTGAKDLHNWSLKSLREMKPSELTQKKLDQLREFVADLFREYAYVERSGMSPGLRKELKDWVNGNGRYFSLSASAQRELSSLPNVRSPRPVVLYRGLLFSGHDLKETKRYDGQLEVGKGLKFLRSVREGTRTVDLEWERASSWTTSREVAMRFAQFKSASSNFEATLNWLSNADKGKIHGDLGFIVSTLARPEDVLVDMNLAVMNTHMQHGNEFEVILKPGTYTCRVNTKYTKAGEVDPIASQESSVASEAIDAARNFIDEWSVLDSSPLRVEGWNSIDFERILNHGKTDAFIKLASPKTRESLLESFDQLKAFYKKYLADLEVGELESQMTNPATSRIVDWLLSVKKFFGDTRNHPDFKTKTDSRGRVKISEMSASQFRESGWSTFHDRVAKTFNGLRFTDFSIGDTINILRRAQGKDRIKDLHRKGRQEQQDVVAEVLDDFFKMINVDRPTDDAEAQKKMKSVLLAAERNIQLLNVFSGLQEKLQDALKVAEK